MGSRRTTAAALVLALGAFAPLTAHAQAKPVPVDQKNIDEAIKRGVEYLKTSESSGWDAHINNCDELILLTLLHAEVPGSEAKIQELLKRVLEAPLERTYKVSLLAMCLEEHDRVKYQNKIRDCAQFLVDNQCMNGQWSYGEPVPLAPPGTPTGGIGKDPVASNAKPVAAKEAVPGMPKVKPVVTRRLTVQKTRVGPPTGDNSNAQYAALGLRACHDAGITIPKETVIKPAKKWWATCQLGEKGKDNSVATGGVILQGTPRGWAYNVDGPAYSSMSAGAIGAVCIYNFILGDDWRKDRVVADGMAWLAKNFTVTENIGPCQTGGQAPNEFLYYYLYALERTGMLYDTPLIGNQDWYFEGARVILAAQKPNGAWEASGPATMRPTWETCFAVLFLKRATQKLTISSDRNHGTK